MHLEIETNVFYHDNGDGSAKTYHTFAVSLFRDNPAESEFVLLKRWGRAGAIGQFKGESFGDIGRLKQAHNKEINNRLKKNYDGVGNVTRMCEPAVGVETFDQAVNAVLIEIEKYLRTTSSDVGVFGDKRLRHEISRLFSADIRNAWDVVGEYDALFEPEPEPEIERAETWGAW